MKRFFEPLLESRALVISLFATILVLFVLACFKWLDLYGLINALLTNLIAAFLFFLIVTLPETNRRYAMKNNLRRQYDDFKLSLIVIFLDKAGASHENPDLAEELRDIKKFRDYFNQTDGGMSVWDKALNAIEGNKPALKEIFIELEILRSEISFVLNNASIQDKKVFSLFKYLSQAIFRKERSDPMEYDDFRLLMALLWQFLAGWEWISGYKDEDIVESLIKQI